MIKHLIVGALLLGLAACSGTSSSPPVNTAGHTLNLSQGTPITSQSTLRTLSQTIQASSQLPPNVVILASTQFTATSTQTYTDTPAVCFPLPSSYNPSLGRILVGLYDETTNTAYQDLGGTSIITNGQVCFTAQMLTPPITITSGQIYDIVLYQT